MDNLTELGLGYKTREEQLSELEIIKSGSMKSPESFLADRNSTLLAKILTSIDLTKLVYGLILHGNALCYEVGKPLESLRFDTVKMNDKYFTFQFYFGLIEGTRAAPLELKSDFETYIGAKNAGLVKALRCNPKYVDLFADICGKLESFSKHKGKNISDIQIDRATIAKDRRFHALISLKEISGGA
jgi:hypothetical protein